MQPFYEHKELKLQTRHEISSFSFPMHLHDRFEIMYLNSGALSLNFPGKEYIMKAGDCALIFPYAVHGYEPVSDCNADYIIAICRVEDSGDFAETLSNMHTSSPVIPAEKLHPNVPEIMKELLLLDGNTDMRLARILIQLLLARTLELLPLKSNSADFGERIEVRAIKYLSENFRSPLTLSSVAEELKISRYALSRLFNERIHTGFTKYINYLRIENAKDLLRGTAKSVLEISLDCGYENLRSFNRVFRKSTGITPHEYRKCK